mmetsp:Transcript_23317/g.65492  ORF Transcript_23317/g.65492 Transcript_23317/m.65492 type:complete len:212 (-) Transcript_23317:91-726(-)
MPAKMARVMTYLASRPRPAMCEGVKMKPSVSSMTGNMRVQDMSVMTEKRLMLSRGLEPPMIFLLSTLRLWNVRLDPIAAPNPAQLKLTSVALARATPPATGSSESTTGSVGVSPRKMEESTTEKKGSMALMVCVKLTATLPRETFVSRLPRECTHASGRIFSSRSRSSLGNLCRRVAHMSEAMQQPTANCSQVHVTGAVNTLSTCLLAMLK